MRKRHKPKREQALFVGFVCFALTKNRRGGFSSQNDVKLKQTNARKVSVKPFQRLAGSEGSALGVLPGKSKFEGKKS